MIELILCNLNACLEIVGIKYLVNTKRMKIDKKNKELKSS